jgi:hypothetical protein
LRGNPSDQRKEGEMAEEPVEVARNRWGVILNHERWRTLELCWLTSTSEMTDDGFRDTLGLFAAEGERARPTYMVIDATEFHHELGGGVLEWRDLEIIPRYNAAGVKKFAFLWPPGTPGTVESGGTPTPEGSASFPTGWFTSRERAYQWLVEE